jgi:hypothetical protein
MANISDFIREYVDWCGSRPNGPGKYELEFTLTTNQADYPNGETSFGPNVAVFATGTLAFQACPPAEPEAAPTAHLFGTGTQYFSDRRFNIPANKKAGVNPFDPRQTEQIRLAIDIELGEEPNVEVSVVLSNWDDYRYSFRPQYTNGVLYGVSNSIGLNVPTAFYTLSFSRRFTSALDEIE